MPVQAFAHLNTPKFYASRTPHCPYRGDKGVKVHPSYSGIGTPSLHQTGQASHIVRYLTEYQRSVA
jgi:hypothetical protein